MGFTLSFFPNRHEKPFHTPEIPWVSVAGKKITTETVFFLGRKGDVSLESMEALSAIAREKKLGVEKDAGTTAVSLLAMLSRTT